MSDAPRVLLVGTSETVAGAERHLSDAGFEVLTVESAREVLAAIEAGPVDCVVSSCETPGEDGPGTGGGVDVLQAVREEHPGLPFVLFTQGGDEELAREAITAGVTDYIRQAGEDGYEQLVARVENAVARRRAEARADRQARVNEVIRDINQALVRADSRKEIEQSVCERLAQSEQYVLAWIADVDDDGVSLRAMGVEGAAIEGRGAISISGDTAYTKPVRAAAARREPVVVHDLGDSGVWEAALDRTPAAVAAIPFVYEQRLYGVLVVYTDRRNAFDDEERRMLAEVGENVAYAMNAVAVRRKIQLRERELRRQNERLEEFASVVSHDLRNPLNVARGHLERLGPDAVEHGSTNSRSQTREDAAEQRSASSRDAERPGDAVGEIAASLDRMEAIIEDVLTLARQGRTVGETEPVDLTAVARQAWANVDTGAASLSVDEPGTVTADEGRLVQLLENLFRNAVEHGSTSPRQAGDAVERGDSLTVTVGRVDDPAGFFVADDGVGVPEPVRERAFEAGCTTDEDGTGFGLAIVAQIAAAHGWEVTLADSDAGGARFEVTGVEFVEGARAPSSRSA